MASPFAVSAVPRVVLTAALVATCTVSGAAQSLGELAKQEAARRESVKSPAKVYTNESLRQGSAPPPSAPMTASSSPAAPSSEKPGGTETAATDEKPTSSSEPKKDEAAWRAQIQAERDALRRAQIFAEALQSRINALTADFTARDDPAQRAQIGSDREKALQELDRVKKEIDDRTKGIADIQAEARKAGVPPGWLR